MRRRVLLKVKPIISSGLLFQADGCGVESWGYVDGVGLPRVVQLKSQLQALAFIEDGRRRNFAF